MKRILLLLLALLLTACAGGEPVPAPESSAPEPTATEEPAVVIDVITPAPTNTPAPTPAPTPEPTEPPFDVAIAAANEKLQQVKSMHTNMEMNMGLVITLAMGEMKQSMPMDINMLYAMDVTNEPNVARADVALSSGGDVDKFWEIFDERLELCHKALMCRHNRLKGTLSDAAPILWQHGACARLKKGEPIDKLLYGGYSTISLGYAGLYECVKYMTGKSHTDPAATPFALSIMNHMNAACRKWKAEHNIDFSLYGTPL